MIYDVKDGVMMFLQGTRLVLWKQKETVVADRGHGGPRNLWLERVTKMVSHAAIKKSFYHEET
jgi:hypothetical protein